jgi:hypothetical protein
MGVESKSYRWTNEAIVCCETETQGVDTPAREVQVRAAILIRFCHAVGKLCVTAA